MRDVLMLLLWCVVSGCGFLSGCGQTGPLYLPESPEVTATAIDITNDNINTEPSVMENVTNGTKINADRAAAVHADKRQLLDQFDERDEQP